MFYFRFVTHVQCVPEWKIDTVSIGGSQILVEFIKRAGYPYLQLERKNLYDYIQGWNNFDMNISSNFIISSNF